MNRQTQLLTVLILIISMAKRAVPNYCVTRPVIESINTKGLLDLRTLHNFCKLIKPVSLYVCQVFNITLEMFH